jgi:ketosteroid isomerase-like protein
MNYLAAVLLFTAEAQTASDTVRRLDSAWARSYATHDTALAKALFADSLVVTGSRGKLKDRNGELGDVRPYPGLQMHYFRTSDVAVRPYGSAAVVTGLAEWSFTMNNQVSNYRYRYTATYVRGGPLGWRMVALHIGPAPD